MAIRLLLHLFAGQGSFCQGLVPRQPWLAGSSSIESVCCCIWTRLHSWHRLGSRGLHEHASLRTAGTLRPVCECGPAQPMPMHSQRHLAAAT